MIFIKFYFVNETKIFANDTRAKFAAVDRRKLLMEVGCWKYEKSPLAFANGLLKFSRREAKMRGIHGMRGKRGAYLFFFLFLSLGGV